MRSQLKDYKKYKLKFNPYLDQLYNSNKDLIIYKVKDGYDIYTDFSKKIVLNNNNINKFFNYFNNKKYKRETDLSEGLFVSSNPERPCTIQKAQEVFFQTAKESDRANDF